ncbi:zinc ABC transporter ATP-binding protein AztA [Okibacterium fritillariae]|uniref:zinc ABC transporter ATP-binding protein AztA n=1 Tax=Okibacterium fritillariae TaxID=123320 RepID=UPI004055867E
MDAAITATNVSLRYDRHAVFEDFSARIPHGRITALTGPNGSGKSSLLGLVAGVIAPTSGTVQRNLPGRVAFVAQRSAVADALPLTVRQTVSMGRWSDLGMLRRPTSADRTIVDHTLDLLGIRHLARAPLGDVSGGQRQRALVAQGLAARTQLLLLDEPTTGIDDAGRDLVFAALRDARDRGVTVVLATHDTDAAAIADETLALGAPVA